MKLATLKDGTRDGQLLVVSRDLHTAAIADAIAPTLQRVVEDWSFYAPQLESLYEALNTGRARRAFGFDPKHCMAPLPRAFRLITASGPRRADRLLGARDDITVPGETVALDFTGGLAVIVGDVPAGLTPVQAAERIRLLMLATSFHRPHKPHETSRSLAPDAFDHCGFSPVVVTLDELGDDWRTGCLTSQVQVQINGRVPLASKATSSSNFNFGVALAEASRFDSLTAGTVFLGAPDTLLSPTLADAPPTWLGFGDRVRLDLLDRNGESVCGVLEQSISPSE